MKFLDLRGLQTLWGQVLASRTIVSATESNSGARISVSGPGEGIAHNYVLSLIDTASTSDLSNLQNSLSAVATSGAASDVAITDTAGNFEATTVEGALAELASATGGGVASKTVHLVDASAGQSDYAKVYNLYQGSDTSDMSNNSLVGTINIPKDLVVQSGKTVTVTNGIDSDGDSTSVADGKYIKLVIQNQSEPIYINVRDLIDVYTGGSNSDIAVTVGSTNEITATLVAVDGAKLTAGSVTKAKLATAVQDSLDLADSAVQSVVEGSTNGTISVDGTDVAVHGLGSAAYTDTTAYDPVGSAAAVLGTNTDAASANTVYGAKAYANEVAASATSDKADKVTNPVAGNFAGLDSNGNLTNSGKKAADFKTVQTAVSDPTASGNATSFIDTISQDTNGVITATKKTIPTVAASVNGTGGNDGLMTAAQAEKLVGVETGAQENVVETVKVNGVALTPDENKAVNVTVQEGATNGTIAVNGTDVPVHGLGSAAYTAATAYDVAGAATTAKSEVIGVSGDAATANTIYGAKAYADSLATNYEAAGTAADAIAGLDSALNTAGADGNRTAVNSSNEGTTAAHPSAITAITGFTIVDGMVSTGTSTTIEAIPDSDLNTILGTTLGQ